MAETHHISDVDTWGSPDRNYYVFIVLSFLFGFFGLDHFYLRSFGTGTQKLLLNICGLGLWYFWDCAQILTEGEKIRKEGLVSPFDWIRGIGRGAFTGGSMSGGAEQTGGANSAQKSYLVYAFLAIFFGWLGADKFYIGAAGQGLTKLLSCFNIFLFLFGAIWVIYDGFNAFFNTRGILEHGISPPMPYNLFFDKVSPEIFKVVAGGAPPGTGLFDSLFGLLPGVPDLSFIKNAGKQLVPLIVTPPVVKAIKSVGDVEIPSVKIPELPQSPLLPSASAALAAPATAAAGAATAATAATAVLAAPAAVKNHGPTDANEHLKPMQGGGQSAGVSASASASAGPGPIIAGALTAIVLAGGLKGTYDFISKI